MKRSLLSLAIVNCFALSACSAINMDGLKAGTENRVTMTLPRDRAFFTSLWGPFGFTSEIDKKDVAELAKLFPKTVDPPAAPATASSAARP